MTTDTIASNINHTVTLASGGTLGNPVTVASGVTVGGDNGVVIAPDNEWAIRNEGSIAGTGSAGGTGYGVYFDHSAGSVGNDGMISGNTFGVYGWHASGPIAIDNSGTIYGNTAGVRFAHGSDPLTIANEAGGHIGGAYNGVWVDDGSATVSNAGTISGVARGVNIRGGAGSVDNSGLIQATGNGSPGDGVYLDHGGSITNETGGTITGAEYGVHAFYPTTVINHGTITGTGEDGIDLGDGGAVTNAANAKIQGKFFGVEAGSAATIDNAGTITATSAGHGKGVELSAGGQLTNVSGGLIKGGYSGVVADQGATIVNDGSIAATGADEHAAGVVLYYGSTLINDGSVSGISGVYIGRGGGTVTNALGGVIAGSTYGIDTNFYSGPATVDNAGTITGTSADGIVLVHGGTVTNAATGTITGHDAGVGGGGFGDGSLSIGNAGTIQATLYGVDLSAADNTLNNTGVVVGGTGARFGGNTTTVDNSGTIHGTYVNNVSYGVQIYAATSGKLVNEAGGTIIGAYGVTFLGANATLENAGRIEGNGYDAVQMFGTVTNRLIIDPGAVFEGTVLAGTYGTAANTIELKAGAHVGTISNLGTDYVGFQTVAIDDGAAWTVGGSIAGFAGVTVEGFNSHDRLDLAGLPFSAGDTVSFDDGSNVLTIKNSGGGTLATIQLDDSADGNLFKLISDGNGGTYAEEDDFTPCYLKGTLIRTADGDVPVERLRIGHWVVTSTGEALPVKWIGRRSYRDWLAVGSDDVQPILFRAGSIADGIPARDLHVSPEHAMFIDGALVPARHLVNGASILKCEGVDEIDYFHLEFDRHVVIFAEDAPAESFVDDDSRMLFHNADEYRRLYPDEPRRHTEFCAPRVEDGPALDALHQALATRAQHLRGDTAAPWGRRGKVELTTPRLITGWAYSGADAGPVPLAVLVNGAVIGRVVADRYRADLKAAGIGNGRHGFRFTLPKGLGAGDHRIEVRREVDWSVV